MSWRAGELKNLAGLTLLLLLAEWLWARVTDLSAFGGRAPTSSIQHPASVSQILKTQYLIPN